MFRSLFLMPPPAPRSTLFPYTTLFRSRDLVDAEWLELVRGEVRTRLGASRVRTSPRTSSRSEEHTSELQSHVNLVFRLLLEKKKPSRPLTTIPGCNSPTMRTSSIARHS